ncbi:MAG: hypothetical protein NT003_00935 [Candidatus Magasanikbacteria bacterium]|nr:hypothetical protein [Candidatus Magasanikbacteria bacterium]
MKKILLNFILAGVLFAQTASAAIVIDAIEYGAPTADDEYVSKHDLHVFIFIRKRRNVRARKFCNIAFII